MTNAINSPAATSEEELERVFSLQRSAYLENPYPDYKTRIDRLDRLRAALDQYGDQMIAAITQDFGERLDLLSHMGDVFAPKAAIKHVKQNLKNWMKPEKRSLEFPYWLLGYKGEINYQPLGVVGVIAPWNAPAALGLIPVINAIGAGNRVMLKPSGQTSHTEACLEEMICGFFSEDEFYVAVGRGEVSREFPRLKFNHIVFTGGPGVARDVMRAAAENLTPVTLELGGKCPVIISRTADIKDSAAKITGGKLVNSGQVCVSPDYVFVPKGQLATFVQSVQDKANSMFPDLSNNSDYTSMFGGKQGQLLARLDEAGDKGAQILPMVGEYIGEFEENKVAPCIVVDPSEDSAIMQEESFGPVLIVKPYEDLGSVTDYINLRDSPLVIYYFGSDSKEKTQIAQNVQAGNMCINDVVLNVFANSLPFGGVGESGMGRYYGRDGFRTLSNQKGTIKKGFVYINKYIQPPFTDSYREWTHKILKQL